MKESTTEQFLAGVRDLVIENGLQSGTLTQEQAEQLAHVKLLYGVGMGGVRGVTIYEAWQNGIGKVPVVEIGAMTQESWIQLAGTLIHELGHVLAGHGAGHSNEWKDAAKGLGFVKRPEAAGQHYCLALISPALRDKIFALAKQIADGSPAFRTLFLSQGKTVKPRPCSAGHGTRGGKSRGVGSGSRLRLWECDCEKPVKVRVSSDDFQAHCDRCGSAFHRA